MKFTVYADGGSRGNPGPAGSGAIIQDEAGLVIDTISKFLGVTTNNVAEYSAVLIALEHLTGFLGSDAERSDVTVRMDSMLVVKQMKGEWKIKHPNMVPLAESVSKLVKDFRHVTFEHIYRDKNTVADRLANAAMDRGF